MGEGATLPHGVVTSESLLFQFRPASAVTGGAELSVSGTRLARGRTAIYVASNVTWILPRPSSEQVPYGVSTVTMTFTQESHQSGPQPQTSTQTVQVTDQTQIYEIMWLTDLLPLQQPGGPSSCPGLTPSVEVKFEDANGNILAEADDEGCGGMGFSIDGRPQDPLAAGDYYNLLRTAFDSGNG
jgi:hypothetical protein